MKIFLLLLLAAGGAGAAPAQAPVADQEPGLRSRLYELAGALGNEGFKVRDGFWSGRIETGKPQRLAVNLFAGNHYWFAAAAAPAARELEISVYGPDGRRLGTEDYRQPGLAAAGLTAAVTGPYFVELETKEGSASDFRLLYLFK